MLKRSRFVLLAFLLLALALPAAAAERVDKLPDIRGAMSGRFELALVLNDLPFIVGKGEVVGNAAHFVLRTVVGEVATLEVVAFPDRIYTREDASSQWYVQSTVDLPVGAPETAPQVDVSAAPISSIGSKAIAGTPTNQYQVWIAGDSSNMNDHIALDFFIGQQINYLYQYQVSAFTTDEEFGELKLEMVTRLYDFDDRSIVVGAPANAIAQPARAGLIKPLRNGGLLSTLSAPLATHQLRALAAERLGR
ncbi:MAG TPA: hypothetical protein VFZ66_13820 [Herpetosiphonaceae bacterium]